MMVSPEGYRRENETKTLEELIMQRTKLYNEIVEYEKTHVLSNKENSQKEIIQPSPKTIYDMRNLYLNVLTDLIIEKNRQANLKNFMYNLADNPPSESLDEEKEFEKYFKLYEERFGKKAYIAEPNGSIKQTITAIKTCLEKNEDILDSLLYPNRKEELDKGFLYGEREITDSESIKSNNSEELYIEELKKLEKKLDSKECFFIKIKNGLVLPQFHKNYYNGVDINIVHWFGNKIDTKVRIGVEEYSVSKEQVSEIENIVRENLDHLINVAKGQSIDEYEGGHDSLFIKIGALLLEISSMNVTVEEDLKFINEFEEKIINVLKQSSNVTTKYTYNAGQDNNWTKEVIQKDLNQLEDGTNRISNSLEFYKKNESDTIWWIENPDAIGEHLFTFDKKKIYNLFRDYPAQLTQEEKQIFDKENPYWADFFKNR